MTTLGLASPWPQVNACWIVGTNPQIAAAFVLGGLRQAMTLALLDDPNPDAEQLACNVWILIAQSLGLRVGSKS